MKKGSVLIITSRGGIVDERALADAIKNGHLRGAAVDVFKDEPDISGCPLIGLDNVLLTPHSSAISPDIMVRAAKYTMENLNRVYEGKQPLRIVNK
jgi:(S)-sulfolactate dehydrogenase